MTENIIVQILEPSINVLEIETQVGSEPINVSILSYSGTNISITHDLPVLPSDINDNIASLLVAGSGINIVYNNNIPSVVISSSGNETLDAEQVEDIVGNLIIGSGYIISSYDDLSNKLIISASGLQPSGNYAPINHAHTTNDITDFNSNVSGLIPVKNIFAGNNIGIVNNSGEYTVSVTGQLGLTSEQVDDRVSSLLQPGQYILLSYNDNADTLSVSVTGLQPSGNYSVQGHTHLSSDITNFNSATSGIINSTLSTSISGGVGIDISYYSNTDTLLISTSGVSLVGHQHTYSEITDFNTGVRLNRINDLTVPSGNVSFNNYRLTNLATPTSGTDAVTKSYIDTLYASTSGLGIASFSSGDFSVVSGIVSVKNSGIDNNQLYYSYITLGTSTINLGSSVNSISGLVLDGGTP
jgi:hypothetical protein